MRNIKYFIVASVISCIFSANAFAQNSNEQTSNERRIFLIGDSTMQNRTGWGAQFCDKNVSSKLTCVNLARGGRSSKSYRVEGLWDQAITQIKQTGFEKTYVLIQFGHNDASRRPERATDMKTEFPVNLTNFVNEVKSVGAIPVLVTPITKRSFKDNVLINDMRPWSEEVLKVAKNTNVQFIDLNLSSAKAVQEMGIMASFDLAVAPPPQELIEAGKTGTTIEMPRRGPPNNGQGNTPPRPDGQGPNPNGNPQDRPNNQARNNDRPTPFFDYTHIGQKGAEVFSKIVVKDLKQTIPDLSKYLVE